MPEFKFTLFWLDGKREVISSPLDDPAQAMTLAGYGGGAARALDFWAHGDNTDYRWSEVTREWVATPGAG